MIADELRLTKHATEALQVGMRLRVGSVIDCIGGGSTGHVYRVLDESLGPIAVREYFPLALAVRLDGMVRPRAQCVTAFQDGLKLFDEDGWQLAAQDHPGLLKVQQVWSERGTSYLAMPWCEGHTLGQAMRAASAPPSQEQLGSWLRAMADALTLVHRRRGLHGNLSPEQVMLLGSGRLVLMEFARARRAVALDPRELERDPFAALECGTDPRYGPVGPWTDIYAIAAMLHFALRGRAPQAAVRRLAFDSQEPLTPLAGADYSEAFLHGIDRGLALRPRARPQNLQDFLAILGLRERRARQRAIGETLLINLPVADAVDGPGEPVDAPADPADTAPQGAWGARPIAEAQGVAELLDAVAAPTSAPPDAATIEEPPVLPWLDEEVALPLETSPAFSPTAAAAAETPWRQHPAAAADADAKWQPPPKRRAVGAPAWVLGVCVVVAVAVWQLGSNVPRELAPAATIAAPAAGALPGRDAARAEPVDGLASAAQAALASDPPAAGTSAPGASLSESLSSAPTAVPVAEPPVDQASAVLPIQRPAEPMAPAVIEAPAAPSKAKAATRLPVPAAETRTNARGLTAPPVPPQAAVTTPDLPAPAEAADASSLSSRCPELLARQYTGRPLDAAEREQLRAQCL